VRGIIEPTREKATGEWKKLHMRSFTICDISSSSFLGSTVQLSPWPPPQIPAEFLGGSSKIFFFTG
jgi:hypothetical protein